MDVKQKLTYAKQRILVRFPFYGMLLSTTRVIASSDDPTAATDGRDIFYNPEFIEKLNVKITTFVLLHEILHKALKHALRRGARDPQLWNIACDYAVNGLLSQAGVELWEHCYHSSQFHGMNAETIYEKLKQQGKPQNKGGGIGNDLREPKGMDQAQRAAFEREINRQIREAATMAKMAGSMPKELAAALDGSLNPQVPWEALLFEYATRVVKDHENWSRRSRRFGDWYFPSLHNLRMGELVVIGDTSGSVPEKVFVQAQAELRVISEHIRPERTRVIWADNCDVSAEEIFEPGDPVVIHPKGRGGTDMRKPLRYVENFNPIVVVLITDGETPWPKSVPYPLITLCTTKIEVPIGEVIRLHGLG